MATVVWLFHGQKPQSLQPAQGDREVAASLSLPSLPRGEIPGWLDRAETEGEGAMTGAFLDRVRNEPAPRAAAERESSAP